MSRRHCSIAALLAALSGLGVGAQADATAALREPGFGRVTAIDGSPWVGAVVHLLHRPHPGVLDESVADRITTTTDARGRFRADLLPLSRYLVWAHEPPDARPDRTTTRVTAFVADGRARTPMFLAEVAPVTRRRFRLATDATWDGTEPRVFAWSGGPDRPDWAVADTRWLDAVDGVFELPPWPDDAVPIAVYGRGWQLWSNVLPTRGPAPAGDAEVATLELPPLRLREVVVDEANRGGPLADVEIVDARGVPGTRPVRSDDWGRFEVARAAASADFPLLLTHAHLRSPAHFERALSDRTLSGRATAGASRIELERATPLHGRLLIGGVPVTDSLVLLEARDGLPGKAFVMGAPRTTRTDAEGRFRLPIPDRTFPLRVTWIPSPAERARLGEAWQQNHAEQQDPPPTAPLVVLRDAIEPTPADATLELDLLDLRPLDLTLVGPGDLPAAGGAELLLFPPKTNPHAWRYPLMADTDRRGRVRILRHGAFDNLQVIAVAGTQAVATTLTPAANRDDLTLHFDPRQVVTVVARDRTGEPWAEARLLSVNPKGGNGLASPCGTVLWFHAARIRGLLQHGNRTASDGTLRLLCNVLPETIDLRLMSADGRTQGRTRLKIPDDADGPVRLEARLETERR